MEHRRSFLERALETLGLAAFESQVMREAGVSSPQDLVPNPAIQFVVLQISYEYNDETHCPAMDQAGFPVQVFNSRPDAATLARKLNHQELRGLDLEEYFTDPIDIWDGDDLPEELMQIFGDRLGSNGLTLPTDATDEELDRIADRLYLTFYEVYEVSKPIADR